MCQGVTLSALGTGTVDTEVEASVPVYARLRRGFAGLGSGVVREAGLALQTGKPLMPGRASKFQVSPGGTVKPVWGAGGSNRASGL